LNNSFLLALEVRISNICFIDLIKHGVELHGLPDDRIDLELIVCHWSKAVADFVFFTECRMTSGLRLHNRTKGIC
jgi:hypothetical protein